MAIRLPASERRAQLIDVAIEEFADRGYHNTSMQDVAEAAGVTKPVLYQHFASKRDLYLSVLDDVGTRLLGAIANATATASGPRRQVEQGFEAYFEFVAHHEGAFRVLFGGGARRDTEFAGAVRAVERQIAETIASLIDVDLDEDHRRVLAQGIVGLGEVVGRHWLDQGMSQPPAVLAGQVADLAWGGLRAVHRRD